MPVSSKAFERYQRINDIFNTRKGGLAVVTTKYLTEILGISVRQLRTDMSKMKEIGAPLEYIARERGWRYTEPFDFSDSIPLSADDILQLRLAVATLAQINHMPEFKMLPKVFEKIRYSVRRWLTREASAKAIYFDPLPNYENAKYLSFFLRAIEETRQVSFYYQSFQASEARSCIFDPYFLRQHNQRWYVGGFSHDPQEEFIRTYPLDRIVRQPEFRNHYFNKPDQFTPPDYWKYIVGINRPPNAQIERVVLEFNYIYGRYYLSKPFFETFIILENSSERLVIELEIIIEIELIQKLASYGVGLKVLHPPALIQQMKSFFNEASRRYSE